MMMQWGDEDFGTETNREHLDDVNDSGESNCVGGFGNFLSGFLTEINKNCVSVYCY